jgi:hypothetical protein
MRFLSAAHIAGYGRVIVPSMFRRTALFRCVGCVWTTHWDREGTDEVMSVQIASTRQGAVRRGPPVGRHPAAVGVTLVLMLLFSWVPTDPGGTDFALQLTQDVLAEASFVLLCLVLMLGPAVRFVPRLRRGLP